MVVTTRAKHIRRFIGGLFMAGSLLLMVVVMITYARQPDHFAAFTLMPVWVWGGGGIFAGLISLHLLHTRLMWLMLAAWVGVILTFSDEAQTLGNIGNKAPKPGLTHPENGKPVIRVITANCDAQPIPEMIAWKPDVVLLQDVWPYQAHRIARELYGDEATIRIHETNAIITHWDITEEFALPRQRSHQSTITMPDGRSFRVANVHLLSAATDLSLWRRKVWTDHRVNRAIRLNELERALNALKIGTEFPETPAILAGDFNAPPGDPVYRMLGKYFRDAHPSVGTGWGNTYHRRFPILRIDRIHASHHFTPLRCGTHVAARSDHRFVVADFILED